MTTQRQFGSVWGVFPVAVALVLWELVARMGLLRGDILFPPFSAVARELYELAVTGVLARNFLPSLQRVLIGFAAGAAAGMTPGTLALVSCLPAAIEMFVSPNVRLNLASTPVLFEALLSRWPSDFR